MVGENEQQLNSARELTHIYTKGRGDIEPSVEFEVMSAISRDAHKRLVEQSAAMGTMQVDVVPVGRGYARFEIGRELSKAQGEFVNRLDRLATLDFELAFIKGEDLGEIDGKIKKEHPLW